MTADEFSTRVVQILNAHQINYMIVGSLSTNFHSIVRSTQDADIVIQSDLGETARLVAREFPRLRLDPQIGFETVTATKKIILRADTSHFVVELFGLSDDAHDQQRFERRIQVDWMGQPAWVATMEDAIITKLRWGNLAFREKDIVDARTVIATQGDAIDWPYVEHWCDEHGSRPLLEKIRDQLRQR